MEAQYENNADQNNENRGIGYRNVVANQNRKKSILRCLLPLICLGVPIIAIVYDIVQPFQPIEAKLALKLDDALEKFEKGVAKIEVGSEYIRWGKKTCGDASTELYSGLAAGSHYTHGGGSAEYLCLPLKPEYSAKPSTNVGTWIYGSEYQSESHIFPQRMHDHNVPCARCYVPKSATIMIPARRTCPSSWTKEYEGYLMSGHFSHKGAHNYVCVDREPAALDGLQENKDGALMYFVQGDCNSLGHCPPYIQAAELTCVVCSK